jgi:hypothetical protein
MMTQKVRLGANCRQWKCRCREGGGLSAEPAASLGGGSPPTVAWAGPLRPPGGLREPATHWQSEVPLGYAARVKQYLAPFSNARARPESPTVISAAMLVPHTLSVGRNQRRSAVQIEAVNKGFIFFPPDTIRSSTLVAYKVVKRAGQIAACESGFADDGQGRPTGQRPGEYQRLSEPACFGRAICPRIQQLLSRR